MINLNGKVILFLRLEMQMIMLSLLTGHLPRTRNSASCLHNDLIFQTTLEANYSHFTDEVVRLRDVG